MNDTVKTGLLAAYAKLLRPLVRILLRHGVTYDELSDVAKTVFVRMAAEGFKVPGKKMSKSRIAIVTGLTRKEVHRLVELDKERGAPIRSSLSRIGRVLFGWFTDPEYTGPYGMPLEVRYDSAIEKDSTFVRLVQRYSGDMTPRAMLDELLRVGAVVETDHNWFKVLRREYVPATFAPDFLDRVGVGIHDFVHTIEANLEKEAPGKGRFERTVKRDGGIRAQDLPLFNQFVRTKCQFLLEEIDNWLSKLPSADSDKEEVIDAGVGIYQFITKKEESEPKRIQDLLDDRTSGRQ